MEEYKRDRDFLSFLSSRSGGIEDDREILERETSSVREGSPAQTLVRCERRRDATARSLGASGVGSGRWDGLGMSFAGGGFEDAPQARANSATSRLAHVPRTLQPPRSCFLTCACRHRPPTLREKQYADGRAKRTMLRALTSGQGGCGRAFVVRGGKRLGEDMTKRLRTARGGFTAGTADLLYARAQRRNRTRACDDEVSKQSETIKMAENLAEGCSALHGAAEDVKLAPEGFGQKPCQHKQGSAGHGLQSLG